MQPGNEKGTVRGEREAKSEVEIHLARTFKMEEELPGKRQKAGDLKVD